MADRKISDLTALTAPASGDYLPIVDISEAAAANKNKRITIEELFRGVPLGTAAAPSIAIEGDEDTGVYSPGANQLAISTGGSGRLFVDASGNTHVVAVDGQLSLSKTNLRQYQLRVTGVGASEGLAIRDESGATEIARFTQNGYFTVGGLRIKGSDTQNSIYQSAAFGLSSDNYITVGTGASQTERLRITSTGTVNIVGAGTAGSTQAISFNGSAPVNSLVVDSSGRCGIGTSSPGYNLDLQTASTSLTHNLKVNASAAAGNYAEIAFQLWQGAGSGPNTFEGSGTSRPGVVIRAIDETGAASGDLVIGTFTGGATNATLTEKLRLTSSGRLGIGTTGPLDSVSVASANYRGLTLETSTLANRPTITFRNTAGSGNSAYIQGNNYEIAFGRVNQDYGGHTESARFDGSGRLLVGTSTSPSAGNWSQYALIKTQGKVGEIFGPGILNLARGEAATAITADENIGGIAFSDQAGNEFALITCAADANAGSGDYPGRLVFSTTADGASSPTERMRLTSTGQLRLAGAGITFNGDTATANELDDYEEGTWTPSLGGTWTSNPTGISGKYVKIGKAVYIAIYFAGGTKSTSTSGYFTGLPFLTNEPGTGQCVDSNVTDCGGALFSNNDRVWISGTSFTGSTQVTGVYFT